MIVRSGATTGRRRARPLLAGTVLTLLALPLGLAAAAAPWGPAAAQTSPAAADPARIGALARPAVAVVTLTTEATVTSNIPVENKTWVKNFNRWLRGQIRAGRIGGDRQSVNRIWLDRLVKEYDAAHVRSKAVRGKATSTATCTGWFVTPTGDLVTAAHCVTVDRKALLDELEPIALKTFIAADVALTNRNFAKIPVDAQMRANMEATSTIGFRRYAALADVRTTISVQVPTAGPDGTRAARTATATVLSAGEGYPGRDVAVLHVAGVTGAASLGVTEDPTIGVGTTLSIDGFPGTIAASNELTAASRREPSFTQGPVSALRTTVDGVEYIQTQAPAFHGSSGSPVFAHDPLAVVGLLVAGAADPRSGEAVTGQEFVLRGRSVLTELTKAGVRAVPGPSTVRLAAALDALDRHWYERARTELLAVRAASPQHPYVAEYLALAERELAAGHDRTPHPRRWLPLVAAAVGTTGLAVTGAGGFLAVRGLRRRRGPAAAAVDLSRLPPPTGPPAGPPTG